MKKLLLCLGIFGILSSGCSKFEPLEPDLEDKAADTSVVAEMDYSDKITFDVIKDVSSNELLIYGDSVKRVNHYLLGMKTSTYVWPIDSAVFRTQGFQAMYNAYKENQNKEK